MSNEVQRQTGYDHAGEFEASLVMALCPEAVDLSKLAPGQPWYTKSAKKASRELGERMVALILADLKERITKYGTPQTDA